MVFVTSVAIIVPIVLVLRLESNRQYHHNQILRAAHNEIRVGLTFDEVHALVMLPLDDVRFSKENGDLRITLYWEARKHQGLLHEFIGYTSLKGHYDLFLTFDNSGVLRKIYGGAN